ncbi:MAG: hypothetical protein ACE5GW_01785, partial [Planctomycetota bacterium]
EFRVKAFPGRACPPLSPRARLFVEHLISIDRLARDPWEGLLLAATFISTWCRRRARVRAGMWTRRLGGLLGGRSTPGEEEERSEHPEHPEHPEHKERDGGAGESEGERGRGIGHEVRCTG